MKKVILAYSGGLDTSVILKWLQEEKNLEVITYTADLGTAIARPLIAKKLVEIGKQEGTNIICHGATGKGNDQIRFEIGAHALNPSIEVIAPWRDWDMVSRTDLMNYCKNYQIPMPASKAEEPPFSMDENLLHISYEGGVLEDLNNAPPEDMWLNTKSLENASEKSEEITIEFSKGDPVALNGKTLSSAQLFRELNLLGGKHGIGRIDIVESRVTGMKSRGCYETPGGTILLKTRRAMESLCLTGEEIKNKDKLIPDYAALIYEGLWLSNKRVSLQSEIDSLSNKVNGCPVSEHFRKSLLNGKCPRKSLLNSLAVFSTPPSPNILYFLPSSALK